MSELSIRYCESCNGKLERVITGGTGLIFKGSGFYLTDYKKDKDSESNRKNKNDDNGNNSKHDTKQKKTTTLSESNKKEKKDEKS
mgnify:CR=1 FL=1